METPAHYRTASIDGQIYLRALGIEHFDSDLVTYCRKHNSSLLYDALLFNACKYFWRMTGRRDLEKAQHYLSLWQQINGRHMPPTFVARVEQCLALVIGDNDE
jgi:hypothetical protein